MGLFKEILQQEIKNRTFQIKGMENKSRNNSRNKKEGNKRNINKLTIKLIEIFNKAGKTNDMKNIDSKDFRQFLADQGFDGEKMSKAAFLKYVYQWATNKQFPTDKYDDQELTKSFDQIIQYYPKKKKFFAKLIQTEEQKIRLV